MVEFGRLKSHFVESESSSFGVVGSTPKATKDSRGCEPLTGRWVYVGRNRTFHAPVCCGWDRGAFRRYPNECGHKKLKPINGFYRGSPEDGVYVQMGGNACRDAKFFDEWEW